MATSGGSPGSAGAPALAQRSNVTLQQLTSFSMRNLAIPGRCSGDLMDLYFKLVIDGQVAYVSEIVRNTLNPVWMPFEPETWTHLFTNDSKPHAKITPLFGSSSFDVIVVKVKNYKMARRKSNALTGKIMADEATADDDTDENDAEEANVEEIDEELPTTGFVFSNANKSTREFDYEDGEEEEKHEANGDEDVRTAETAGEASCTTLVKTLSIRHDQHASMFEEDILHVRFNICDLDPLPIGLTEIANLPLNTCLLEFSGRLYVKREVIELLVEMGVIATKHSRRKGSAIQLKEYSLHDGLDNLERICALKQHIEDATEGNQALQEQIKQRLLNVEASVHKEHRKAVLEDRIQALRRQIHEKSTALERVKTVMQDERRTFETDIHIPKALLSMMQMGARYKDEKQGILERRCEVLRAAHKIRSRQAMLVRELGTVYPIEYVGAGEYTIRGIKIANSDLTIAGRTEEEQVTTALGYIAHLVFMLSKYLNVNLRYKIIPYSSRSYIKDDINDPHGEYPLYRKGIERERFERATFFLRKNVEQLLFARGLDPTQGNPLLGRLKALTDAEVSWLEAERDASATTTTSTTVAASASATAVHQR